MSSIPLSELPIGSPARLESTEPESVSLRLRELGFVPGTQVTIVRRGFLGDPLEVELRGYRICLRRNDLARLRVSLEDPAA